MANAIHVREEGRGKKIEAYWPLAALVIVTGLAAWAIAGASADGATMRSFMHAYMGVFLVFFALLKLFDLEGFKDGFAMYDLLARRVHGWGYVYPFIELALGLAYLGHAAPVVTGTATIVVFAFGALGVASALRRGLDIDCPCMGNTLRVPLSTVTLTEDVAMIVMAGLLLASGG